MSETNTRKHDIKVGWQMTECKMSEKKIDMKSISH